MLDTLITSKTRVKILYKLFLNPETRAHLRGLAEEFGESTNSVRLELDRLSGAGILTKAEEGRKVIYGANPGHPLFPELNSAVRKFFGIDRLIDMVLSKLGDVEHAFVTGDYARGVDSGIIDVVIVGKVNHEYLRSLVEKAEDIIKRKIRTLVLSKKEFGALREKFDAEETLLVWEGRGNGAEKNQKAG